MLNVTLIRGDNQYAVSHHFSSGDDYYTKQNPGQWQGVGAQNLGLAGAVDPKQFGKLLDGHHREQVSVKGPVVQLLGCPYWKSNR